MHRLEPARVSFDVVNVAAAPALEGTPPSKELGSGRLQCFRNGARRPFAPHVELSTVHLRRRAFAVSITAMCCTVFAACANEAAPEPPTRSQASLSEQDNSEAAEPEVSANDAIPSRAQAVLASNLDSAQLDPTSSNAPYSPLTGHEHHEHHEHRIDVRADLPAPTRDALRRSLEQRLSRSLVGLPRNTLRDGSESVDTHKRFQHVVVQVRDAEGNLRTECLENRRQLEMLLTPKGTP